MKKNSFLEKIKSGQFVVTTEVSPPKGANLESSLRYIEPFKDRVDAVNVTDQQSSIMRLGSLTMSNFLIKNGYETIYQITCRDRNRIALESDLLSASSLGIKNVLVLTGDHPTSGDHPQAKPVFDLDAVQLLKVISRLEEGFDMVGNKLDGVPEFFTGAVVNPGVNPIEPEIVKLEKKLASGAEFFQTQAVYDVEKLESFLSKIKHVNAPIVAGIIPIKSLSMAKYINDNLAGVTIPDDYIKCLDRASNLEEESINLTVKLIEDIKGMVAGVHIMPINWPGVLGKVLDVIGR